MTSVFINDPLLPDNRQNKPQTKGQREAEVLAEAFKAVRGYEIDLVNRLRTHMYDVYRFEMGEDEESIWV